MDKWANDGEFGNVIWVRDLEPSDKISDTVTEPKKRYECPRGHEFQTSNPIIIAVDDAPEYNSGPICAYCYVDWFKLNLNAKESVET